MRERERERERDIYLFIYLFIYLYIKVRFFSVLHCCCITGCDTDKQYHPSAGIVIDSAFCFISNLNKRFAFTNRLDRHDIILASAPRLV